MSIEQNSNIFVQVFSMVDISRLHESFFFFFFFFFKEKEVYIGYNNNEALFNSCASGNLDLVRWLCNLDGGDVHAGNDNAFRLKCRSDHFEIAKFLYNLGGVDVHADNDEAFKRAVKEDMTILRNGCGILILS